LWRGQEAEGLEPAPEQTSALPYDVKIDGPLGEEVRSALLSASQASALADRPPPSELLLRNRAAEDVPRLRAALNSLGYYNGEVSFDVNVESAPPSEGLVEQFLNGKRAHIVFKVQPGERYRLGQAQIVADPVVPDYQPPSPAELGLTPDAPAAAERVLNAEKELVRRARARGHAFAKAGDREVIVDHGTRRMDVTLRIDPGPRVQIGDIAFTGDADISDQLLRRRVPARPGSFFDPEELEQGRENLVETNLFSSVRLQIPDKLDESNRLPITYSLIQRKHRSIGAGLGYRTDEGLFVNPFWEHRNLLGAGELLHVDLLYSLARQEASVNFRKPDVGARRQNLLANGTIKQEDTEAFESRSIGAGIGVEREFDRNFTGTLGLAYRFANVQEQNGDSEVFGLLSLPASLAFDRTDNLLDATRGWRLAVEGAPYLDTLGIGRNFFKSRLTHSRYFEILPDPRLVLALRGSVGSILGSPRSDIPADERFYAGGGGSVRGIPFQHAGPLNKDEEPLGGRSLLEMNSELRFRITETIGLVGFVDGGSAFEETYPDFSEELRFGAGLGLRYATPIGPIRLDVAVPVERDPEVDDPFQLYVSIGQAF
jgi:translocation and assembly module TamA